jgi:hypothetical protein
MQISTGNGACPAFSCGNLFNGCPVPGPAVAGGQWASCFSGCCSSSGACANGALPGGGGGCVNNAGPGPHTPFFDAGCPNAYAFPDNDGTSHSSGDYLPCSNADKCVRHRCCWLHPQELRRLHLREHGSDAHALPGVFEPLLV